MKDQWIELLLSLFEKTLAQLKTGIVPDSDVEPLIPRKQHLHVQWFKNPEKDALRVLMPMEQIKLTKTAQQFLLRMQKYGILSPANTELVLNQLIFSDSRYVGLDETKWTIRNVIADQLDADQMAFLDLVLYQKEDGLATH